jgi:hypothetical protein
MVPLSSFSRGQSDPPAPTSRGAAPRTRRIFALALACATTFIATSAVAADLGTDGKVHFAPDALAHYDFENPSAVATIAQWVGATSTTNHFVLTPFAVGDAATALPVSSSIEGSRAFTMNAGGAVALELLDPLTFASLATKRVTISFWGHADGMEPVLLVSYGIAADAPHGPSRWARVATVRTGRETSDGWVEYTTGAIDGTVIDRPIHDLVLTGRVPTPSDTGLLLVTTPPDAAASMSIDAIEIDAVPGAPTPPTACSQATLASACGPSGECMYGKCVDSSVVWGALPGGASQQQEIVDRSVQWGTRTLANRAALAGASSSWVAAMDALVSADATPHSFWSGLNLLTNQLRDAHTHLGSPNADASYFAARPPKESGALDVCWGPMVDDLEGGKLGYGVIYAGGDPIAGVTPLERGDLLESIDGGDPQAWISSVWARYGEPMPDDPAADMGPESVALSGMLTHLASTVGVRRCSVSGVCSSLPLISLGALTGQGVDMGATLTGSTSTCSTRFSSPVSGTLSAASPYAGITEDLFVYSQLDSATLGLSFNGFENAPSGWQPSIAAAEALPHANVLVDARDGHGGEIGLAEYLFQQFRDQSDPMFLFLAGRGSFEAPDTTALVSFDWSACGTAQANRWTCVWSDIFSYTPSTTPAPFASSRVAWLDTNDVSCNDMLPLLLDGAANVRIFGPVPTYGAIGNDVPTPAPIAGWSSGSIAVADGRMASDVTTAQGAAWRSGTGVAPDQVVVQTVSDSLVGNDTVVSAARAWLGE